MQFSCIQFMEHVSSYSHPVRLLTGSAKDVMASYDDVRCYWWECMGRMFIHHDVWLIINLHISKYIAMPCDTSNNHNGKGSNCLTTSLRSRRWYIVKGWVVTPRLWLKLQPHQPLSFQTLVSVSFVILPIVGVHMNCDEYKIYLLGSGRNKF